MMPLLLLSLCWLPRRVMPYSALVALIADLLSRACDGCGVDEQAVRDANFAASLVDQSSPVNLPEFTMVWVRLGTPSSSLEPEDIPPSIRPSSTKERWSAITTSFIFPDQKDSPLASLSPLIADGTTTEKRGENPSDVINTGQS